MTSASMLPIRWRKSSYSSTNGGECIEIGKGITGVVPVRDSKDPHGPALVFEPSAWSSFVDTVKGGKFAV
ncbi:hypothetical protein SSP35_01_04470 [Streptomyces sp. NBRC 110611]|uniref:DUF397 domain-containing protein n=1 Tax=Streptomyces sp. NBRC 110611 TaxID=1621259 RepID=UPI000837A38C|nr:DUF397 domain-containing protein [Streptomyces sp. NBRC 110611]GAU65110.1 hypothetical protein SSP35_01_04470 [Streptomyces sp. NBRC 110611]